MVAPGCIFMYCWTTLLPTLAYWPPKACQSKILIVPFSVSAAAGAAPAAPAAEMASTKLARRQEMSAALLFITYPFHT